MGSPTIDVCEDVATLYRDGIVGKERRVRPRVGRAAQGGHDDCLLGGDPSAGGSGRTRTEAVVHRAPPAGNQRFVDLVTHPWVTAIRESVLGPEYEIVKIGFDTPFQGAKVQPWHRDFPSPKESYQDRRITSLAFNITGVDVTEDMGPFEIALGTQ
jgi:Phytanoyl-CoA dioxygenase (PhyH)